MKKIAILTASPSVEELKRLSKLYAQESKAAVAQVIRETSAEKKA